MVTFFLSLNLLHRKEGKEGGEEGRKGGGREGGHYSAILKRNALYKSLRILLFVGFVLHLFIQSFVHIRVDSWTFNLYFV